MGVRIRSAFIVIVLVVIAVIMRDNALRIECATIKIGLLATLTGPSSELGVSGRNAVAMAVKQVNESGGVLGRSVEIITKDLQSMTAHDAMNQFLNEGVRFVVGPYRSDGMDFGFSDPRLLVLSPTIANRTLDETDDNLIRFIEPAEAQGRLIAQYIGRNNAFTRIAIVADNSNHTYTSEFVLAFKGELMDHHTKIVYEHMYETAAASDFAEWSQNMYRMDADAVLIVSDAPRTAMMAQQLHKIGWGGQIFTGMWSMTEDLLYHGGQAVEGTIVCGVCDPESSETQYALFREQYTRQYGSKPSFSAALSYEATELLLEAIIDRNTDDPAAIKSALIGKSLTGLQDRYILNQYGDPKRPYQLFMVKDRSFRRLP